MSYVHLSSTEPFQPSFCLWDGPGGFELPVRHYCPLIELRLLCTLRADMDLFPNQAFATLIRVAVLAILSGIPGG
jgi:hypothetical protein